MKIDCILDTKRKEVKRVYFDSIPVSAYGFPITDSVIYKKMGLYAPRFLYYWNDNLGKMFNFKIVNTLNNEEIDNIKVTNVPELVSCLNQLAANNPLFFGQITLLPYDIVDSSIPAVSGIYGFNFLYSIYKGRHKYSKRIPHADTHDSFVTIAGNIMRDVYQYFCGVTLNPPMYQNNFGKHSFWFSGSYDSMYDLPFYDSIKGIIEPNSQRNRYNFNISANNFEPLVIDADTERRKWYISDMLYVGFHKNTETYVLLHRNKKDYNKMRHLMSLYSPDAYSFVAMYKVVDSQNPDRVAVIIKAIGIDHITIEDVDFLKYDIEAIEMGDYVQPFAWIRNIKETDIFVSDKIGGKLTLRVSDLYVNTTKFSPLRQSFSKSLNRNIFLRLRDKNTGHVGEISNTSIMIEHFACNGLAPFRYMMKSVKGD